MSHPYLEALTASGISLLSLESFQSQWNRYRREAIRLRIQAALTAAAEDPGTDEDNLLTADEDDVLTCMAKNVAPALQVAMQAFLDSGDHSQENWIALLTEVLTSALHADLEEAGKNWFLTRDLPTPTEEDLAAAVRDTIEGTSDIRMRLLEAAAAEEDPAPAPAPEADPEAVLAGLSLPGFLSIRRIIQVARGLGQAARDKIEQKLVVRAVERDDGKEFGYTGRKRLRADPNSKRHGMVNLQTRHISVPFRIRERKIGNRILPATTFMWPRSDPTNVAEWSNSRTWTELEWRDKDTGTISWR